MTPFRSALEHALLMERVRLCAVLVVLLGSLVYLGAALHQVQIVENPAHASDLDRHSIRRVRIPATRGRILDRFGTPLADSVPDYTLGIFVEEWRQRGAWSNTVNAVDAYVDELAAVIGRPREITRSDIERHILRRRPLALTAWTHLGPVEIARFSECTNVLRGADIQVRADRVYPFGNTAAHIVGYVGRAQPERPATPDEADDDTGRDFDYYLSDLIGRDGIEKSLDATLAGRPGGELVRIDAIGYKHAGAVGRAPMDGRDIVLSLDIGWQREAERLLEGRRGAIVVVDVATGELPVLASAPRFDLRDFLPSLSFSTWRRLNADPAHPLINRATQGIYPPGSTLKPFVALAALDAGVTTRERIIECDGAFQLGDGATLRCGHRLGHGPLGVERAIEQSCNVYFCQVGTDLGYEPALHDSLALLGLGRRPAIQIPSSSGLLPTSEWKRRVHRDSWRRGDTANLSIGQGFLLVTPLQMALATAAIANGGDMLRPRLVLAPRRASDPGREVASRMPWRRSSLDVVRRGMWRVVNGSEGGGRRAHLDGLEIAAKTGTAEYLDHGILKKHAWMIAYAPYRAPKYAMAVVVEDGESGGKTAAPLVRRLFAAMYGLDPSGEDDDAPAEYHDLPPPVPEEAPEEALDGYRPTAIDGYRQPSTAFDTPGAAFAAPPAEGGLP